MEFWYGTALGRFLLEKILKSRMDQVIAKILSSPFSKIFIPLYIKRHQIDMEKFKGQHFRSFAEFFARECDYREIDLHPFHLISPCDGWLSAYKISRDSSFKIKGSNYQICDLVQNEKVGELFQGGICLIFRLCASDYHHYCYIDDGQRGESNEISGELHSVQPIACEHYPVYTLNRRVWTFLETEHFGPVIQTEIGAFVVGKIVNETESNRFFKGMEKGHFELGGSTIVLMFQKGKIRLLSEIQTKLLDGKECRVLQGMWIGERQ